MLDQGQTIADCTVVSQLAQFDSRFEYLVKTGSGEEKLVQFNASSNWSRAQRQAFHDQIKALGTLNIHAVGVPSRVIEQEGELFCLYPLPLGVPLQDTLIDERSVRSALELIHTLTDLLEPAHQQQLFHGALSPNSIYLDNGKPFLADFSLASLVAFDYRTADEVEYASPEQIRGETPGTAADIYSLGCLLYALLMGRPPFLGDDAFTVGMQHLNDSFPEVPEALVCCAELLQGMTVKSASERMSLAQVRAQCEELLNLEVLDQIPRRDDIPPSAADEEHKIEQDAIAMVARIEDQLRDIEARTVESGTANHQTDEELSLSSSSPSPPASKVSSTRRIFSLLVGVVVGFCLGALFFDFFLSRPVGEPPPTVYSVDVVAPDYTNSTHLWLEGDLDGAERELERLLSNFPDHPQIHNNLAAVAAVRGDIEAARDWLEQAIVLDIQTATIYRNLGSVYAEIARDSYGRALQFDYEQTPLQLDLFTNKGVTSSPLGVDTIVARIATASDQEKSTRDVVESSVPLSPEPLSDEPVETSATSAEVPADAGESEEAIESTVAVTKAAEVGAAPVVEPEDPVAEQVAPVITAGAPAVPSPEDPAQFLGRWAAAWSAQDVEGYLAFYSADFIPGGGLNYDEWVRQRRQRLQQPEEILVTLKDVDVRRDTDDVLQLEVVQEYRSERYSDLTRKLFDLRHQDGSWKIERERSLELIYR